MQSIFSQILTIGIARLWVSFVNLKSDLYSALINAVVCEISCYTRLCYNVITALDCIIFRTYMYQIQSEFNVHLQSSALLCSNNVAILNWYMCFVCMIMISASRYQILAIKRTSQQHIIWYFVALYQAHYNTCIERFLKLLSFPVFISTWCKIHGQPLFIMQFWPDLWFRKGSTNNGVCII